MKPRHKKSITLPNFNQKASTYTSRVIELSKAGCYDPQKRLKIDGGFGDYNMSLFRLKNRKKIIKNIPTAFTPTLQQLLQYRTENPRQQGIAAEHNQKIRRILSQPKELYIEQIKKQKQQMQAKQRQEMRMHEFVKGQDVQVREFNQHLSFNYLTKYEADHWFKIKDKSQQYSPPINLPEKITIRTQPRSRKKVRHVSWTDAKARHFFKKTEK